MVNNSVNTKEYDLEQRTQNFAIRIRALIKSLPKTVSNFEDTKQLSRALGSVGANFIETSEGLSKKDFLYRIKICRKEVKESHYFLNLIDLNQEQGLEEERKQLMQEA